MTINHVSRNCVERLLTNWVEQFPKMHCKILPLLAIRCLTNKQALQMGMELINSQNTHTHTHTHTHMHMHARTHTHTHKHRRTSILMKWWFISSLFLTQTHTHTHTHTLTLNVCIAVWLTIGCHSHTKKATLRSQITPFLSEQTSIHVALFSYSSFHPHSKTTVCSLRNSYGIYIQAILNQHFVHHLRDSA